MSSPICTVRKLPLHRITDDTKFFNDFIYRVNSIVREAYQFLKLFLISKLEADQNIPLIDRKLMNNIYYLITSRKRKISKNKLSEIIDLQEFYSTVYEPLQQVKINGNRLGQLLDLETVQIVTAIENNLQFHYYDYITYLCRCIVKLEKGNFKHDVVKLRKVLYHYDKDEDTETEMFEKYGKYIAEFGPVVQALKSVEPQQRLPLIYRIEKFIEKNNDKLENKDKQKLHNIIPLRRTLIPKSICVCKSVCKEDMEDIEIWNNVVVKIEKIFKKEIRKGFQVTSFRTDGIYASVLFQKKQKKTKKQKGISELYVDEVNWEDEERETISIDPNKGNLLFCINDEGRTLRYTQNSVRKARKKTRYKAIRKSIEKPKVIELQRASEEIQCCNSKTVFSETFKEYIGVKNKQERELGKLYQVETYRKLNFNSWMNNKRSEDRFVNKFKEVYGTPDEVIVTIGDWEQRRGISHGKEPTKGIGLRRMFRRQGFEVYLVDERLTSKRCSKCHGLNEYNYTERLDPRPWKKKNFEIQKVWELSRCKNCGVVHNRDLNASKNIREIVREHREGRERPVYYRKNT